MACNERRAGNGPEKLMSVVAVDGYDAPDAALTGVKIWISIGFATVQTELSSYYPASSFQDVDHTASLVDATPCHKSTWRSSNCISVIASDLILPNRDHNTVDTSGIARTRVLRPIQSSRTQAHRASVALRIAPVFPHSGKIEQHVKGCGDASLADTKDRGQEQPKVAVRTQASHEIQSRSVPSLHQCGRLHRAERLLTASPASKVISNR